MGAMLSGAWVCFYCVLVICISVVLSIKLLVTHNLRFTVDGKMVEIRGSSPEVGTLLALAVAQQQEEEPGG
jgi:hypothetical protein